MQKSAQRAKSHKRRSRRCQKGQTSLEYILLLFVIVGIFIVVLKPFFASFKDQLAEGLKSTTFDPDNPNFYYYPIR